MKSDVFFVKTKDRAMAERLGALKELLHQVDPFSKYKPGDFIPIKLTAGDTKCIYHISPELIKLVVSGIKKKKAKPFLFDTNVIYTGSRQNAVDHLNLVQNKGFGHSKTGAPFIIADGLFGRDGIELGTGGRFIEKARVPSFVGILDNIIVLSHVTGHILSGYAGAIKNVAMGMSSRATKRIQHSSIKPTIIEAKCTACGCCIAICPVEAITLKGKKAYIDPTKCIGCAECLCACKFGAVSVNWDEDPNIFCQRMVEVAKTILPKFKNSFFINFLFDISKECDCISTKDEKIISSDIGILASKDPVSIDKATTDLINKNGDIFATEKLHTAYKKMFEYAGEVGLGNPEYHLVEL